MPLFLTHNPYSVYFTGFWTLILKKALIFAASKDRKTILWYQYLKQKNIQQTKQF